MAPFEAFEFHMQMPEAGQFEGHVGKTMRPLKSAPKPLPGPPGSSGSPRPGGILPPRKGLRV